MTGVAERLDRRIEVLTRLIEDGAEAFTDEAGEVVAFDPPTSLNKARLWNDPRLGIERIGDPAAFTRNHARHGSKVKEIDDLIRRLPRARRRGRPKTTTAENADLKRELANARDLVRKLTCQLAALGQELRDEREQRSEAERVLAQQRSRERRERQRRGAAALRLVGAAHDDADDDADEHGGDERP